MNRVPSVLRNTIKGRVLSETAEQRLARAQRDMQDRWNRAIRATSKSPAVSPKKEG